MSNYDASQVGVPYVRAHRIVINYPDGGKLPTATIEQSEAVKLADGTVRALGNLPAIEASFDLATHGTDPIPLVSPENAEHLGADTSLNMVMLSILAVVRAEQLKAEAP